MAPEDPHQVLDAYFRAIENGESLDTFYATDDEAGPLAPIVKVGSGTGEVFTGHAGVTAAVRTVTAVLQANRLETRGPILTRVEGPMATFLATAWWEGRSPSGPFASLTRWTGLCRLTPRGWRFIQLHVSEEAS